MRDADVCLRLFLAWLAEVHGRRVRAEEQDDLSPAALGVLAGDGAARLAIEVHHLLGPTQNQAWLALRDRLQERIAAELEATLALWLPAGADLPSGAAESEQFVRHVQEAASILAPGERSAVSLPIAMHLRKVQDDGALISVSGGLNPHWARLSEGVRGSFDLDSTRLHRLPEAEEQLDELLETVRERARGLDRRGEWVEIETVDPWTVQRLEEGEGATIVGLPPAEIGDMGLAVRRNFRRLLAEAAPRLRQRETDTRALVVLGYYARLDQEGATVALRGYDPALYANLDFVCLAADGMIKPLIQPPAAR